MKVMGGVKVRRGRERRWMGGVEMGGRVKVRMDRGGVEVRIGGGDGEGGEWRWGGGEDGGGE